MTLKDLQKQKVNKFSFDNVDEDFPLITDIIQKDFKSKKTKKSAPVVEQKPLNPFQK